jgi:hypothetical protein
VDAIQDFGVGSAERAWCDVKHIKKDKRAHLLGEKKNMQTTLYGANCVEMAEAKRRARAEDPSFRPIQVWDEEDFDCVGLSKFGVDIEEVSGLKNIPGLDRRLGRQYDKEKKTQYMKPDWLKSMAD